MKDNTILRIKVPARLYEAVKAQLTIDEGKHNFGTKDMKPVKGQKASGDSSDKPKKTSAPKAKAPKKAEAPAAEKKEVSKDGHKKAEKKPRSIEELKAAYEVLGEMIAEMEKGKDKVEESKWGREEYMDEPDYDEERGAFVKYAPKKKWRPKYVPKGQSTMTTGDIGHSSLSKFDPSKEK